MLHRACKHGGRVGHMLGMDVGMMSRGFGSYARSGAPHLPGDGASKTVALFPGHGIGPELMNSVQTVVEASGAPIQWDVVSNIVDRVTPEAVEALLKHQVAIKGEFVVEAGRGSLPSINMELRKAVNAYANVIHSFKLPGVPQRHENVDIVIVRENLEGEYTNLEHEVSPGITESLKVMSKAGTRRIAQYAFEYAYLNARHKVTAVHKANIQKMSDGLFLESCREVAAAYPSIEYEEMIVDATMMKIVSDPSAFDVVLTPNFYGSLVSNCVAGLAGGAGLAPGANIGDNTAIFEQGTRHVGLDIAGQDVANPTGAILASCMMLRHLKWPIFAERIEDALYRTLENGTKTKDVGGSAYTSEFVAEICARIKG